MPIPGATSVLNWFKRFRAIEHARPERIAIYQAPAVAGKSAPLYKYLKDRYADAVVLSFAEIEDLLGFQLPAPARVSESWWTSPDATGAGFADSWVLASRTARPNLQALTVVFDRVP